MKLKRVAALCKQAGTFCLLDDADWKPKEMVCQWLGDGSAFYPITGLPYLEQENIIAMFDITGKQSEKMCFKRGNMLPNVCLENTQLGEIPLETLPFRVANGDRGYMPLLTPDDDIIFIDEKYLSPLDNDDDYLALFARMYDGGRYVVAKSGMIIQAVIFPVKVIETRFMLSLRDFHNACLKRFNRDNSFEQEKKRKREEREEQEKQEKQVPVDTETGEVLDDEQEDVK